MTQSNFRPALRPAQKPTQASRQLRGVGPLSATPRAIVALILREMATTYGRSPGGYLWAVLDPVAGITVLSIVFGLVLTTPPIGNSFPLFYATGYLPFMLFNEVANKTATSIKYSRGLLNYPVVTFIDAIMARWILAVLTHLMVGYLTYFTLIQVFGARSELNLPVLINAYILAASLGLGVGILNCYLMTTFPIWERSWQIATRPLFLISGIFFTYGSLPSYVQNVLWYNPIVHITGMARAGFYGAYRAEYISNVYVISISVSVGVIGLLLLRRHYKSMLE